MVETLATGLDVKVAAEVTEVAICPDGVRVSCADGAVETGSHVVVTVPLGVLKQGRPRVDPPLPGPVRASIDALGFGRYEKVALRFETPFWRDARVSHLTVFCSRSTTTSRHCGCST